MEPSASHRLRPVERVADLIRRIRAIDPHAVDALVALALTVAALVIVVGRINGDDEFRDNDFLGTALVLLQTLPLAMRRVAPLGALVVIDSAIDVHAALGYEMVQAGTFGSLIALYGAASLTDSRRGIVAALIMVPAFAIFFATNRQDFGVGEIASICGTWAAGWFMGTYIRIRGEQAEAASERAAWLERDRDVRAREAVAAAGLPEAHRSAGGGAPAAMGQTRLLPRVQPDQRWPEGGGRPVRGNPLVDSSQPAP